MIETPALPKAQRAAPLLIFVHLPKTAGTTVAFVLGRQYGNKKTLNLYHWRFKRIRAYLRRSSQEKSSIQLVRGHIGYGIHRKLKETDFKYFTILRNPIDRVVSHYFFHKNNPNYELSTKIQTEGINLEAYITKTQLKDLDNYQTRLLAGEKVGLEPEFGACQRNLLNTAKRRLQKDFAVVGTTERFDETLLVLQRVFKWNIPVYISANVTKNRPRGEEITPSIRQAIMEYSKFDIELHQYADERLDQLIAEHFKFFKFHLFIFKTINKFYNYIYRLSLFSPGRLKRKLDATLFVDSK